MFGLNIWRRSHLVLPEFSFQEASLPLSVSVLRVNSRANIETWVLSDFAFSLSSNLSALSDFVLWDSSGRWTFFPRHFPLYKLWTTFVYFHHSKYLYHIQYNSLCRYHTWRKYLLSREKYTMVQFFMRVGGWVGLSHANMIDLFSSYFLTFTFRAF